MRLQPLPAAMAPAPSSFGVKFKLGLVEHSEIDSKEEHLTNVQLDFHEKREIAIKITPQLQALKKKY